MIMKLLNNNEFDNKPSTSTSICQTTQLRVSYIMTI